MENPLSTFGNTLWKSTMLNFYLSVFSVLKFQLKEEEQDGLDLKEAFFLSC